MVESDEILGISRIHFRYRVDAEKAVSETAFFAPPLTRLVVKGVSGSASRRSLIDICRPFGRILNLTVTNPMRTGQAFEVVFGTPEAAAAAQAALNQSVVDGCTWHSFVFGVDEPIPAWKLEMRLMWLSIVHHDRPEPAILDLCEKYGVVDLIMAERFAYVMFSSPVRTNRAFAELQATENVSFLSLIQIAKITEARDLVIVTSPGKPGARAVVIDPLPETLPESAIAAFCQRRGEPVFADSVDFPGQRRAVIFIASERQGRKILTSIIAEFEVDAELSFVSDLKPPEIHPIVVIDPVEPEWDLATLLDNYETEETPSESAPGKSKIVVKPGGIKDARRLGRSLEELSIPFTIEKDRSPHI